MPDLFIDTNVLVDHFRGEAKATHYLRRVRAKNTLWISVITLAEIHAAKSMGDKRRQNKVRRFLNQFRIAFIDNRVAILAGEIVRQYQCAMPDALIAAAVLNKKASLVTRNVKHFDMIKKLKVVTPY